MKYPDVPPTFARTLSDFADTEAWGLGMRELKGAAKGAASKALGAFVPLAWELHLLGGSGRQDARRLSDLQTRRSMAESDLVRSQTVQPWRVPEYRGFIEAMDRSIADLVPLVEAARTWKGKDNVTLRDEAAMAEQHVHDLHGRIAPYTRARLPYPREWDEELLAAQRKSTAAVVAFKEQRAVYDELCKTVQEARAAVFKVMREGLGHRIRALGAQALALLMEQDFEFLSAFPGRAPDEVLKIHADAERIAGIFERLGGGARGLTGFWKEAGTAADIISGKLRTGRNVVSAA